MKRVLDAIVIVDGVDLSRYAKHFSVDTPTEFSLDGASAHFLGDCPKCGAVLTPAIVTEAGLNGPTTTYEVLLCSEDTAHTWSAP